MMGKKILKKIDRDILDRMLVILYEYGKDKRTHIARKSDMAYDKCVLYLDFLEMFGFIKKETSKDGFEIIGLTEHGIKFCKTKLNERFAAKQNKKTPQMLLV